MQLQLARNICRENGICNVLTCMVYMNYSCIERYPNDKKEFREEARIWRRANNLSQEHVANELKVTRGAYSNFERGKTNAMSSESMDKLREMVYGRIPSTTTMERKGPLTLTAMRLRMLADILESRDFTPEVRGEELAASIKSLYDRMPEIITAVENFKK